MVDLRRDGEQVRQAWRSSGDSHVPLPLAAALALHEAHGGAADVVAELEYEDALNLAAAALSRLVSIYTIDERTRLPVPAMLNLATGRFRAGASVYERRNGRPMTSLVVLREHVPAAMDMIKATGIPFRFRG